MDSMVKMQKFLYVVNTGLAVFVLLLLGLFAYFKATLMIYISIPIIAAHIFFYYLIRKRSLHIFVWCLYAVILVNMLSATLCLGYNCGFHLYCMSLLPVAFYIDYMAHKFQTKPVNAVVMSVAIVCVYLISTVYIIGRRPLYEIGITAARLCLLLNALCVFGFLIGYTRLLQNLINDSESKLSDMAHTDQLTGLFNRHYTISRLDERLQDTAAEYWLAILDIDGFKTINDTYGHNCGDYVLIHLAQIMRRVCSDCIISRWGGEEFVITADGKDLDPMVLETLRQAVEQERFSYQDRDVVVTVTIGTAYYRAGQSLDHWIQQADEKLYQGKNSGKNQVVY